MARIVYADIVDADSAGITADLANKAGRTTAIKFSGLFDKLYERLERHPESGTPRPTLGRNIRIGVVAPYIVIYRYTRRSDTVEVLRIVHGHRRLAGSLLKPSSTSEQS